MTIIRSLAVACVVSAANLGFFSVNADAYGPPINTNPNAECTAFEVHRNVWHLRCVVRHEWGEHIYYVDQDGQWYLMAD